MSGRAGGRKWEICRKREWVGREIQCQHIRVISESYSSHIRVISESSPMRPRCSAPPAGRAGDRAAAAAAASQGHRGARPGGPPGPCPAVPLPPDSSRAPPRHAADPPSPPPTPPRPPPPHARPPARPPASLYARVLHGKTPSNTYTHTEGCCNSPLDLLPPARHACLLAGAPVRQCARNPRSRAGTARGSQPASERASERAR